MRETIGLLLAAIPFTHSQFFIYNQLGDESSSNDAASDTVCKDKLPICVNIMCWAMGKVCAKTCGFCNDGNSTTNVDSMMDYFFEGFDSLQVGFKFNYVYIQKTEQ